jgi:autotransporter translocation and assembly factor TamB
LAGLDTGKILAALQPGGALSATDIQSAVSDALRTGATPFSRLDLDGNLSLGTITLSRGDIALTGGSIAATGNLDLPGETIDAHLALRPALENSPLIGLRLIGPVASPTRLPELADLTRWLAQR